MLLDDFVARLAAWVRWYNTERPHRMLNGRTPLAAGRRTRHLCTGSTRTSCATWRWPTTSAPSRRAADGIHLGGHAYVAPEIHGRVGKVVQIRYMPHDDRPSRSTSAASTCAPRCRPERSPPPERPCHGADLLRLAGAEPRGARSQFWN
ncbi:integrase core domain-containing protein, partial [Streptomyces sp. NPDC059985]|uniref:integrase core domain-containing protein n=1 Tax=Streptomyces sp. NPDC059985 TaxID=3347025 RepID=UPI00367B0A62